jgi:twitching motility protein PilT
VILVGEIRDRETLDIALSAAETGHLVLSTLHTVDAGQTINRILGMFDRDEEALVRIRLAATLRWIVSQRLLPKIGGGRVTALEILCTSLRVKDSVLHGESEGKTFYEIVEAGGAFGMQTFDQDVLRLFQAGLITEKVALAYASHKTAVRRGIDDLKKKQGLLTTDIEDLALDSDYGKNAFGSKTT